MGPLCPPASIGMRWDLMLFVAAACLSFASAQTCISCDTCDAASIKQFFFANSIMITCLAPGAIPLNATGLQFEIDFERSLDAGSLISLVRSTNSTYARCDKPEVNLASPTALTSGHLTVGSSATPFRVPLGAAGVGLALAAMDIGFYDVCRREGINSAWQNTRIKVVVQSDFPGIELNSIRSAKGLTGAFPRGTKPAPILRCAPPGCPPGSILAIIPSVLSSASGTTGLTCGAATAAASKTQSGFLTILVDGTASGTSVLGDLDASVSSSTPYQVCFRKASSPVLAPTGVSFVVQTLMTALEVNNVYPNGGFSPWVPKAPGSIMKFDREILPLGYTQQVQLGIPVMMYSFEGTDVSVAKETKCEVEVCKPGLTFYDADVTSPWDRVKGANLGTGMAMGFIVGDQANSLASYAVVPKVFDTGKRAFTVEFFMKPIPCPVQIGCQQPILAPYGDNNTWASGSVALYYRPVSEDGFGIQLTIIGYQSPGNEGADTVNLRYPNFKDDAWFHVAIILDASSGVGTPQLVVNGALWDNPQPLSLVGSASFRFGPLVIGATVKQIPDSTDTFVRGFRGYFDELAIFDYALNPVTVSLHYNRSAAVNVPVSRRGHILLVGQQAQCDAYDPASASIASSILTWEVESDNDLTRLLVSDADLLDLFPAGQYQVCISLSGRLFDETGILLTVQTQAPSLAMNGVAMSLGLRSGLPIDGSSSLQILSGSAVNVTAMSLIRRRGYCNLDVDNPTACSPGLASGRLNATQGGTLTNATCRLNVGQYQVCVKIGGGSFQPTGLSVQVQAHATSFSVNGAMAGGGMRIQVSKAGIGNVLMFYGNATAASADEAYGRANTSGFGLPAYLPGVQTASPSQFVFARGLKISLISEGLDCAAVAQNPASGASLSLQGRPAYASGHHMASLITATGIVSLTGEMVSYISAFTIPSGVFSDVLASLPPGAYHFCSSLDFGLLSSTVWSPTGIGVSLQYLAAYLTVNLARPSQGLRVAFPASTANLLALSPPGSSSAGYNSSLPIVTIPSPVLLAVIPATGDCAAPRGSTVVDNTPYNTSTSSGYLIADGTSATVTNATTLGWLTPGAYQLCFSAGGSVWQGAGIGITVQNVLQSISVNLVSAGKGLRVWVPRSVTTDPSGNLRTGNIVTVTAPTAFSSFKLAVIEHTLDCASPADTSSGPVLTGSAGASAGTFAIGSASAATLSNLTAGLYQVCFAPSSTAPYVATGVTVQTHDDLVGLSVNGIVMRPSAMRTPLGVVATAALRLGSTIVGIRPSSIIGQKEALSVVGATDDCALPSANPEAAIAGAASGWMVASGTDGTVSEGWGIEDLSVGVWQVCHRAGPGQAWTSSGLSLRLQADVYGVWFDLPYAADGLHSEYSFGQRESRKEKVAFNGTTGRVLKSGARERTTTPKGSIFVCGIHAVCDEPVFLLDSSTNFLRSNFVTPPTSGYVFAYNVFEVLSLENSAEVQVCFKATGASTYSATGVTVGLAEVPTNPDISSLAVNSAQFWGRAPARVPYGSDGTAITYTLKKQDTELSTSHQFRLAATAAACNALQITPWQSPLDVIIRTDGAGKWSQSDVNSLFGRQGIVSKDDVYAICYRLKDTDIWQVSFMNIQRQVAAVAMRVNGLPNGDQGVRIILPKIAGTVFQYQNVWVRTPQVGDMLSFISPQGQCDKSQDNPMSTTATASGHMVANGTTGRIDVALPQQRMYPLIYQVCARPAGGNWTHAGMRVEIIANSNLVPTIAGKLSPNRAEALLPRVDVDLVTDTFQELVNQYDGSTVFASLFRCTSPCGALPFGLASCPLPCTNWANVSNLLDGTTAPLVNGHSTFTGLIVKGTAGRLFIRLSWNYDLQSVTDLPEMVSYPPSLVITGIAAGASFEVGGVATAAIADDCRAEILLPSDWRCFGYANLGAVAVLLATSEGAQLLGLSSNDSFAVEAMLVQGAGGGADSGHEPVLDRTDMLTADVAAQGDGVATDLLSRVVAGGFAYYDAGTRLLVRRQAGAFFRVLFWLDGLPANASGVTVLSPPFSIAPAQFEAGAFDAGGGGGGGGDFPGVEDFVELPAVSLSMKDRDGRLLDHARCDSCAYAVLVPQGDAPKDACTEGFGVGDANAVGCGALLQWEEIPNQYCGGSGADLQEGVSTKKVCQALCWARSDCAGLTFYPEAAMQAGYPGRCWLTYGACVLISSLYGTVLLRPVQQENVRDPCLCPLEAYDNRTLESAIKSDQVAPGTRYTPARAVVGGAASFTGMWVKYRPGQTMQLSLKILGVPNVALTSLIAHVPGPSQPQSYSPAAPPLPRAQCACAAREGLEMLTRAPFSVTPGAEFAENATVASLLELRAILCRCYLPNQAQGQCMGYCS